jgi:hypothetical protein
MRRERAEPSRRTVILTAPLLSSVANGCATSRTAASDGYRSRARIPAVIVAPYVEVFTPTTRYRTSIKVTTGRYVHEAVDDTTASVHSHFRVRCKPWPTVS